MSNSCAVDPRPTEPEQPVDEFLSAPMPSDSSDPFTTDDGTPKPTPRAVGGDETS